MRYIISYDLNSPGQNYDSLYERIEQLRGIRILESQWLVDVPTDAGSLIDQLKPFIDSNDRLLVNGIGNANWAEYNLMTDPETV